MGDFKMNKNGIVFYNFGSKCVARLLVALYSLRRVYNGPVTLMLATKDDHNQRLLKQLETFNINFIWFDLDAKGTKRNVKSILKPYLFTLSPYENTLLIDADVVFLKSFNELFKYIEEKGFLVTQFSNWVSSGRTMAKRLEILRGIFNDKQMEAALNDHPAVNIGVLGYNKPRGDKLLRKWTQVTEKVAGKFIADEVAMQGVYFWYSHYVAEEKYNYSCHYGKDFSKANIIHYHGSKASNPNRFSSRLWWGMVKELKDLKGSDIDYWLLQDPGASQVLKENPNDFISSCYNDLQKLIKNGTEVKQEDEGVDV
jgi:hypothetical protein